MKDNRFIRERAISLKFIFDLVFIAIITLFSVIAINRYIFPYSDHSIYIPLIKVQLDPTLYPNDYLPSQLRSYTSLIWPLWAAIYRLGEDYFPLVFLIIYMISLYTTFLASYFIVRQLFGDRQVALLSVFLLLVINPFFADMTLLESAMLFRTIGLPLALFAIYTFLRKQFVLAYILLGVCLLVHSLTGIYTFVMIFLASLYLIRHIGWRRMAAALGIFVIFASPIILSKLGGSGGGSFLGADAEWLDLMRLRSSHHVFPFSWDRMIFINTGLMLLLFVITWKHRPAQAFHHYAVLCFTAAVMLMSVAGVVFSEIIPSSIMIQLQFLRSMVMLFYFVPMYFANYFFKEIDQAGTIYDYLRLALLSVFIFDLIGDSVLIPLSFFLLTLAWGFYRLTPRLRHLTPIPAAGFSTLLLLIVILFGVRTYFQRGPMSIRLDTNDPWVGAWVDVQRWARLNTPKEAIFVAPPQIDGFRVESERSIYTSWKDGTLAFFDELVGEEWMRRLHLLGYDPANPDVTLTEVYRALDESVVADIAAYLKADELYVVIEADQPALDLEAVYSNDNFAIYHYKGSL